MADYNYLLEHRLSKAQQEALGKVREIARNKGLTAFLAGGAVRDLTSGSPVRDLDVVVQGNALKLKKELEKAHAVISAENELMQALYVLFPGGVRMEIGSTVTVSYPKPGKPVVKPATILDDLRRRDFTANSMALSLNDGSYALLMDPLNGVADIENRELRLVSNYGFIEDPVRMIRAVRLMARLGWQMDERTQARYETGKQEGYISAMSSFQRGYETEEIFHEEDPQRVIKRLESEGWMKHLFPALTSSKANHGELEKLRDAQGQLQMQGINPDASAANFPLLTAKMAPKDVSALKKSFPRKAFVHEIDALEKEGKAFAAHLTGKDAALPSQAWKLLYSAKPEAVLWAAHYGKGAAIQNKFKGFYTEWPQARLKIPYALMQEMRIVPDVPRYDELLDKLFFELMDNKLGTVEEMKAFLEPYSPPAPPPPVHLRRARAVKKDAKPPRSRKKAAVAESTATAEGTAATAAVTAQTSPVTTPATGKAAKAAAPAVKPAAPAKGAAKQPPPAKKAEAPVKAKAAAKPAATKPVAKSAPKKPAKVPARKTPVKKVAAKPVAKKQSKAIAKKAPAKKPAPAKKAAKKR
ncbi:CCA tRNA nucleotidyltransferase [Edaphobacter sp.]|uniref:CCA tRNA nucleotidyltransferase n=1 Tax=Edaphobacter sp. TaxID=1934404 RepID=UPI002DBE4DDD|nr:CCA tRNA nucleotidyltransferase [Edaphobacter sp.]HEU5339878.1 CCA tRNA nucleotidyltransferase [Edaphobacter sp.]